MFLNISDRGSDILVVQGQLEAVEILRKGKAIQQQTYLTNDQESVASFS